MSAPRAAAQLFRIASAARSFVPPATTRAGTAQRAVPTNALDTYAGGEGARRAGEGDSVRFKVPVRDLQIVEATEELGACSLRLPLPDQNRPIQPAGRFRRGPLRSANGRERNFFSRERAEPSCFICAGFEFDSDGSFFRQVNRINLPRLCQTIGAIVDQFVVRFGFPPFETGEEIYHVFIALEHDHRVVAPAIDPASTGVRPDVDAASRAFSRRSVSAGHRNLPGASPQSLGGIRVRFWRPVRIMILIAVLFVGLRYDPAGLQLNLSFLQH